ncbi:HNH endonuclease [Shewanella sedimentimangrovi]|uniref:HNH endonuclease n=1 Tax=Shewanella sedimentimangrovi TaxID=2814293 RepID=A0ABX7R2Y0_9GAMM|nr:HNH endonuclease [Shewanella sedimentimangrovi]QSX37540.1 HNH endonuclease [Shewanella sedimentimangrovi]
MTTRKPWTRNDLLVAFYLYNKMPFGQIRHGNKEIAATAELMGRTASSLSMKMANIASCDPSIIESGRSGLSGASKADRDMWLEMSGDRASFYLAASEAVLKLYQSHNLMPPDIEPLTEDSTDYSAADNLTLTKARIGQGQFRLAVLSAYDFKCCITGIDIADLLVASHIVPWRLDAANRLNPSNGLCLSALHDKAFDKGLITLNEQLEVMLSSQLLQQKNRALTDNFEPYENRQIFLPKKFMPSQQFLSHHRNHIFQP